MDILNLRYLLVIQLEMLKQVMTWGETLHCEQHKSEVKVIQLCPTLCDTTGYTVLGILQARKLEWVAFPFSRGSSQHRDHTQASHISGRFFTS